jgi:hypothetical protein
MNEKELDVLSSLTKLAIRPMIHIDHLGSLNMSLY